VKTIVVEAFLTRKMLLLFSFLFVYKAIPET